MTIKIWQVDAFTDEEQPGLGPCADPYRDVVQSANRLRASPFLHEKQHISGFVYNVATGLLERVEL